MSLPRRHAALPPVSALAFLRRACGAVVALVLVAVPAWMFARVDGPPGDIDGATGTRTLGGALRSGLAVVDVRP